MPLRTDVPIPTGETMERFWSYLCTDGGDDACWPWTSFCDQHGNPTFRIGTKRYNARTLIYRLFVWDIPPKQHIVATCKNRICMNAEHLTLVPISMSYRWYGS
jgi:hypothetical protein